MTHLLAISVGPVQEFIAAARRTRDLWFGSYLLSEISRAVAKAVAEQGGKLIFPATTDAENVANVILAESPNGDPKAVAGAAKEAAQKKWKEFADETRQQASGVIRSDIWNDQVDDVIEYYVVWVVRSADYKADRSTLMRMLAGRKNCRDFLPAKGRAGVPKSSLDGQRETVLKDGDRRAWPKKLRLSDGEQLDVVGVVKRIAEGTRPYPSVARVAAETWLSGVAKKCKLEPLKTSCAKLVARGLNSVREEKYAYFPYEGTVIYKDRHPVLRRELGLGDDELDEVVSELRNLGGDPSPYVAVLVADGDRMGAAISQLESPDAHREFSTALAGFADEARNIVTEHNGVLVYAGGDDVLAFLPADKSLCCARKLHGDFGSRLAKYGKPTLSVGIAIGHFMENLEDLLEYGRASEKAAKIPDRDGLAVHLHKRGGAPIRVRAKWSDKPDERLKHFAELMNDGVIPTKLPYELREMANLYERWDGNAEAAIQQDLLRLIAKKASRSEGTVRQALSEYITGMTSGKLQTLAEELLVARLIASVIRQAGGEE